MTLPLVLLCQPVKVIKGLQVQQNIKQCDLNT